MSADLMAPLVAHAERVKTGGVEHPVALTRKAALAEVLVKSEGARAEHAEFMAELLLDRLQWPSDFGPAIVLDPHGQPAPGMTVADLVGQARAGHGWAFAGGPVTPPPASTSLTAKALAEDATRKASQAKADETGPNPYNPATRNLTRQAILENRDPATAARLRAEAGA